MSANVDAMIREGINAYRAGKKDEARALLLKAVELDEQNEQAWMWLSAVVDTVEDQKTCLENVITINPNNEKARQGLRILSEKAAGSAAITSSSSDLSSAPTSDDDAFASVSFTQNTPPAAGPFSTPGIVEEDELPTSVVWDVPATETSSPSATYRPSNEPSASDYDDWVAGLNLGGSTSPQPQSVDLGTSFNASPFVMDDDIGFGYDEADVALPDSVQSFAGGPFDTGEDIDEEFNFDPEPSESSPAPKSPALMQSQTVKSPLSSDALLDDSAIDDYMDTDLLEDYDQAELGDVDPQEFFKHIPPEIAATRLPGTNERAPILGILGLLLLVALNVGAVAWAVMTLMQG